MLNLESKKASFFVAHSQLDLYTPAASCHHFSIDKVGQKCDKIFQKFNAYPTREYLGGNSPHPTPPLIWKLYLNSPLFQSIPSPATFIRARQCFSSVLSTVGSGGKQGSQLQEFETIEKNPKCTGTCYLLEVTAVLKDDTWKKVVSAFESVSDHLLLSCCNVTAGTINKQIEPDLNRLQAQKIR